MEHFFAKGGQRKTEGDQIKTDAVMMKETLKTLPPKYVPWVEK
jgi:hypothetical protein